MKMILYVPHLCFLIKFEMILIKQCLKLQYEEGSLYMKMILYSPFMFSY